MQVPPDLRPTLWRTCRVLANRKRLKILGFLLEGSAQTVSSVARHARISLSAASKYLRLLESRGLLVANRIGARVKYRAVPSNRTTPNGRLVSVLRAIFDRSPKPEPAIFRLVTAFTHPRRVDILRALRAGPLTIGQLQPVTRISPRALQRHLSKLEKRGFVRRRQGLYSIVPPSGLLRRELNRLTER
jgi:DNA-binding transcriptional ArsR family regulator